MRQVYADNAATSYPKPKEVSRAICNYIESIGSNVGRGSYESAYRAAGLVYETRELLCDVFNYYNPLNVVFTMNVTESLNTLIKGLLKPADHVIVSSMEHNAVMRPLFSEQLKGIEVTRIMCSTDGTMNSDHLEENIKSNTKAVIMTHASNVCGTILPAEEIGLVCKKHNIPFILDSAQSAGALHVNFEKLNLSALAFTGHKGLLGPQGIGGFIIDENLAEKVSTFKEGGTGSFSENEFQPNNLPDKFESGTLNVPGIYGLNAGLKFLKSVGIESIYEHEKYLSKLFLEEILNMSKARLCGLNNSYGRTAVFSLDFPNFDNSEIAFMLDREFGIMTRVGLHCAPSAHKTLGTFQNGSVRFSFGYFNTSEDVKYIADSINKVLRHM